MSQKKWNPYVAGALVGVLVVLSVLIAGKYFGASTTFPRSAAWLESVLGIDYTQFEYFVTKGGKYGPIQLPNWQLLFVIGIVIGSFGASMFSKTFKIVKVPEIWKQSFGDSSIKRYMFAFLGGVITIIGARMAGGCPSGHGISGMAQMSVSAYLAMAGFFGMGAITAYVVYKRRS